MSRSAYPGDRGNANVAVGCLLGSGARGSCYPPPMKLRFMVPARVAFLEPDQAGSAIGAIDSYRGKEFPLRCTFHLLMSFEAESDDANTIVSPEVEVRSPDGELLSQRSVQLTPSALGERGEAWIAYVTLPVAFTATTPGEHEIQCRLGAAILGSAGMAVMLDFVDESFASVQREHSSVQDGFA